MNSENNTTFAKYKDFGAYHWAVFDRDPRKHDLFTCTRYHRILDSARIESGMVVLDLGCGDGALAYLAWLKNRSGELIGIEPEAAGRKLAEGMFQNKNAKAYFLESSSSVPDESQDVILCADVIEHERNFRNLLSEIRRLLKPGGRAVISTPVRLTEFPMDKEHVREFFPEELREEISNYLEVINHEFCSSVFVVDLYTWRPRIFCGRPIFGWIISFLSLCYGINLMKRFNPGGLFWMTQIVTAVKK